MNYLIWNIRGLRTPGKLAYLNNLITSRHISFLALLEPKHDGAVISKFACKFPFSSYAHFNPINKYIWLFWDSSLVVDVVLAHEQHITVSISTTSCNILLSVIYGSIHVEERVSLWNSLSSLSVNLENWVVAGDFNAISSQTEKLGGLLYSDQALGDFNNFISSNSLLDIGFTGDPFTWCNGAKGINRIWIRLDRVLVNLQTSINWPNIAVQHLTRHLSDHCPLLISFDSCKRNSFLFKFKKHWIEDPIVNDFINNNWVRLYHSPWLSLDSNLQAFKKFLKDYSFKSKDTLKQKVGLCEQNIKRINEQLQISWDSELFDSLKQAKDEHLGALNMLESCLREKARVKWLSEGDRNTAYFHACIKERHFQSKWNFCLDNGDFTSDTDVIGPIAVSHFSNLFTSHAVNNRDEHINSFVSIIPSLISTCQNEYLTRVPDWEEIYSTIFKMDPDSAPGPDGYNGHFFRKYANVLKDDLTLAIAEFFNGHSLPKSFTSTIISLIPKKPNPTSMNDVRPISLCNFKYKIISKILCDRLAPLLNDVISDEQSGFVKGRLIVDNVLLAHDLINDIDRKTKGGNVVIKVDMAKAYDKLEWSFLIKVMAKMGFSQTFCNLVLNCISNNWFSVQIHGKRMGYFKSSRGLRQGDPLSSSLFIIAQEALSRQINFLSDIGDICSYKSSSLSNSITHLLFADDLLLFTNGKARSLRNLISVLHEYELCSGQSINKTKSTFLCSNYIIGSKKRMIKHILQMGFASLPVKYLGIPLFKGRIKKCYFDDLVANISSKIFNWKNRFLSHAGKITLVNSVLSSMSIYLLSCIHAPKGVINKINQALASFFWSVHGGDRTHWCSWNKICLPTSEGGLGVKSLDKVMEAFQIKHAMCFIKQDSLCAKFFAKKYGKPGIIVTSPPTSNSSQVWKLIHKHLLFAINNTKWVINNGECSFWMDNWSGNILWFEGCPNTFITLRDALNDGDFWNMHAPDGMVDFFHNFSFNQNHDKCISTLTSNGSFKLSSIYEAIRNKADAVRWLKFIWHKYVNPKASILNWKIINKALPVDVMIQSRKVSLASKCVCCVNPNIETLDHLFVTSDMAVRVWTYFGGILNIRIQAHSFFQFLNLWMSHANWKSQFGAIIALLGSIIPWNIWLVRNQVKFGKGGINWKKLFESIFFMLHQSNNLLAVSKHSDFIKQAMLKSLNIDIISPVVKSGSWHKWKPPPVGKLKLNIDGSSINSLCAGGGVVRDWKGDVHIAFCLSLGPGDCSVAEANALLFGLEMCKQYGIQVNEVETDSKLIFNCLNGVVTCPWNIEYTLRSCNSLLTNDVSLFHTYREGNMLADQLSKLGHQHGEPFIFYQITNELVSCYDAFVGDHLGLAYFRPP